MATVTATIPDHAFVAVMVVATIQEDGSALIAHSIDIPDPDLDSLARVTAPIALRKVADELDSTAPEVLTLPEESVDDE